MAATITPNSKIYYPLYSGSGVSSSLSTAPLVSQAGSYTAPGIPTVYNSTTSGSSTNISQDVTQTVNISATSSTSYGFDSLPSSTKQQALIEYCKYYNITYNVSIATATVGDKIAIDLGQDFPQPPLSVSEWGATWAIQKGYLDNQGKSTLFSDKNQQSL